MTNFETLEAKVLQHAQKQGLHFPSTASASDLTRDLIGHQIIDQILLCQSLGVDFTECLETAYINLQLNKEVM